MRGQPRTFRRATQWPQRAPCCRLHTRGATHVSIHQRDSAWSNYTTAVWHACDQRARFGERQQLGGQACFRKVDHARRDRALFLFCLLLFRRAGCARSCFARRTSRPRRKDSAGNLHKGPVRPWLMEEGGLGAANKDRSCAGRTREAAATHFGPLLAVPAPAGVLFSVRSRCKVAKRRVKGGPAYSVRN